MLAISLVLFYTQTVVVGPNAAAWLPLSLPTLGSNKTISGHHFPTATVPFLNITGMIIDELARNGSGPCYDEHTNRTKVIGLPETADVIFLPTNVVHRFWLQSLNSAGQARCAGGDYYEVDLSNSLWRSRPPTKDMQNGTYQVEFLVSDAFAGQYNLTVILLYDAYHGVDFDGEKWFINKQTVFLHLHFVTEADLAAKYSSQATASTQQTPTTDTDNLANLKRCGPTDFVSPEWSGRWTRPMDNDSCLPDHIGRYKHCFSDSSISCRNPSWCSGNLSRLESLGWSYSAHCAFHIFELQEAWDCLDGRWLFFWGDSNHQDTLRNLLYFVLGIMPALGRHRVDQLQIDRAYQNFLRNPNNPNQSFRLTNVFNGHELVDYNGIGLDALDNQAYRDYVAEFFKGNDYPDTIVLNSGLHDGVRHFNIPNFARKANNAMEYWGNVLGNVTGEPPLMVYRTTVAPAGLSKAMKGNPHKMEVFNKILTEKVRSRFPNVGFVDDFDMTFPFHYNNNYSDGGHYGRPPDGHHYYFVDIMLCHVLLNAICPLPS